MQTVLEWVFQQVILPSSCSYSLYKNEMEETNSIKFSKIEKNHLKFRFTEFRSALHPRTPRRVLASSQGALNIYKL